MKSLIYVAVIAGVVWMALSNCSLSLFDGRRKAPRLPQTLPELFQSIQVENERREDLAAQSRAMWRCLAEKDRIAQAVFAGRLELLEAAAVFRDLQSAIPKYDWQGLRAIYAGGTDEERLCRAVIGYVSLCAEDSSACGTTVLDRLETELRLHLERGTLRLRGARSLDPYPRQLN